MKTLQHQSRMMRKWTRLIILSGIITCLASCEKTDNIQGQEPNKATFESVAKKLNIRYDRNAISQLQRQFKTPAEWEKEIQKQRAAHTGRPHKHVQVAGSVHANKAKNNLAATNNANSSEGDFKLTLITPDRRIDIPVSRQKAWDMRILDIAEEQGIRLPYSDRAGASSTCVAKMVSGMVDQSDQSFLDDEDIDNGWILTCMAYMLTDVTIRTHMEDEYVLSKMNDFNQTVSGSTACALTEPEGEYSGPEQTEFDYLAGKPLITRWRNSDWVFFKGPGIGWVPGLRNGFGFKAHLRGKVKLVQRGASPDQDVWSWYSLEYAGTQMIGQPFPTVTVDCTTYNETPSFTPETGASLNNILYAAMQWDYTIEIRSSRLEDLPWIRQYQANTPFLPAKE